MAETIQEAFLIIHQRGGDLFEGLAQWRLDGTLPKEPMSLYKKTAIGATAGAIGVSTLGSIGAVHAQSDHVPTGGRADTGSIVHESTTANQVDITGALDTPRSGLTLDTSFPNIKLFDFKAAPERIDITNALNGLGKPKVVMGVAPTAINIKDTPTALQTTVQVQATPVAVANPGPWSGSLVGDSIAHIAGDAIPNRGYDYGLNIAPFTKSGMPLVNPLCDVPDQAKDCAKTLDGIRMEDLHSDELADDQFVVLELGRNAQDKIGQPSDPFVQSLERNLSKIDEITGADGEVAKKFIVDVASGPGDKSPNTAAERSAQLSENADRLGVTVVPWSAEANQHPEWFSGDGVHFNSDGSAALADLIAKTVSETMANPTPVVTEVAAAEPLADAIVDVPVTEALPTVPTPVSDLLFTPGTIDITQAYQTLQQADQASSVPILTPDVSYHGPSSSKNKVKHTFDTSSQVDISATPSIGAQPTTLDEYAPGSSPKEQGKVAVIPATPVVEQPAVAPPAEFQPTPAMTPDQLSEALGVSELDNQILQQIQAGGDINLNPIVDFYLSRPDLAPPQDGLLTYPLPLATTLDLYTFSPNTCQSERRLYPDQAAANKVMTVWYNYLVNNDPRFTSMAPSMMENGDAMSNPHNEHRPQKPAMDLRTVLIDSPPGSDSGPAFEPGQSNTDLEEEILRMDARLRFNGQPWLNYSINDSWDLHDRVLDLKRPNGKQYELQKDDHPDHEHAASFDFFEPIDMDGNGEIINQPSTYAPCADGATLTTRAEVADFTNQWAQQIADAANAAPAPASAETPAPVAAAPVDVAPVDVTPVSVDVQKPGIGNAVDISTAPAAAPANIVTDTQAPTKFAKPQPKAPPVVTPPPELTPIDTTSAPVVVPPVAVPDQPVAPSAEVPVATVARERLVPNFAEIIDSQPISEETKNFLKVAAPTLQQALMESPESYDINYDAVLAMVTNESAGGQSKLAVEGNNFGGNKAPKGYNGQTIGVKDDVYDANGNLVNSQFIVFPDMLTNFKYIIGRMNEAPYYKDAVNCSPTPEGFMLGVEHHVADDCVTVLADHQDSNNPQWEPGYATSTTYVETTLDVMRKNGIDALFVP